MKDEAVGWEGCLTPSFLTFIHSYVNSNMYKVPPGYGLCSKPSGDRDGSVKGE